MVKVLTKSELQERLRSQATTLGLTVYQEGADGFSGQIDSVRAKWFLGGRKLSYRMSCRLDEAALMVQFREAVYSDSWAFPPPSLTVENTTRKGGRHSGKGSDGTASGDSEIDFERVR